MKLWDPIRCQWVAKTPEEEVRQELIRKMVEGLGYPKGLISVERGEGRRRYDLLCFAQAKEGLMPLLLVECKAGKLGGERQAFGYNAKIQAPFVCLASSQEVQTFWKEKGEIRSVPFLPPFSQLIGGL